MTYDELTYDRKNEIAGALLAKENENVSMGELCNALEIVGEERLRAEYGATSFVPEDFWDC